ncbi:PREDICTED: uncharacterized protein LOC104812932 [Tarenaya hassleriana]|uniref:uncharacterized protein LOC104812932 n=1 Tax=Tarenaya hassleriana TaxID=28532 RepID=UPI00053C816D|nr:PREDICTED: uncharacterized protein LOC104812932 [Tarenaya hassleriana]
MTMSRDYLGLILLITFALLLLLGPSPSLCSRSKLSSEKLKGEFPVSASILSRANGDHTSAGDSSLMGKVGSANSMVAGFFRFKFPFFGWPFFPKYHPVPLLKPALPSVPTTPGAEESEKLPSSPSTGKDNGAGQNPKP